MALFGIDIDLLDEDSNLGAAIAATISFAVTLYTTGVILLLLLRRLQRLMHVTLGTSSVTKALSPTPELKRG